MKKLIVNFTAEQGDYLQRLGAEVDSKVFLIDRMFANHANDTDVLLFESAPFKHYMKQYEEARLAWETAKEEFQHNYLDGEVAKQLGYEGAAYNWEINDFLSYECEVTVLE